MLSKKEVVDIFSESVRYTQEKYQSKKDNTLNALLKREYGISLEYYREMLTLQDNCCAICLTNVNKLSKRLAVDHCHKTGIVRGLICSSCNMGLGYFKDNPESLKNAIDYLRKFLSKIESENTLIE